MQLILSPRRKPFILLAVSILLTFSSHSADTFLSFPTDNDWTLKSQKKNYTLYTYKDTEGNFWVKGTTMVEAEPNALVRLLDDTQNACEWIANCINVTTLEQSKLSRLVKTQFSAPWPVTNREVFTQSDFSFDQEGQVKTVLLQSVNDYDASEDFILMGHMQGKWVIEINGKETKLSYIGTGNAGGNLPDWLNKKTFLDSTKNTFKKLKSQIEQPKYQTASN